VRHAIGPGDVGQDLTGIATGKCFASLVRRQLGRTAHVNACGLGARSAFARSGLDQIALKFGEAAEHGQHQPAMGSCGVGPSVRFASNFGRQGISVMLTQRPNKWDDLRTVGPFCTPLGVFTDISNSLEARHAAFLGFCFLCHHFHCGY
jgi:hypothetical protein